MICWVQDKSGATWGSFSLRTRWQPWIWPQTSRSRSVTRICQLWAKATNCWDVDRKRRIRGNLSLRMQCRPWIWPQRSRSRSAAIYGQYLAYSMNCTSMTREGRIRGKIFLRTWCWPWIWYQRSRLTVGFSASEWIEINWIGIIFSYEYHDDLYIDLWGQCLMLKLFLTVAAHL